jgi:hypothetical protein
MDECGLIEKTSLQHKAETTANQRFCIIFDALNGKTSPGLRGQWIGGNHLTHLDKQFVL